MRKSKRITAIVIAVIMMMSIVPVTYGAETVRSYTYTFEESLKSNDVKFSLEAQSATNTSASYALTQEGGIGGKSANDKAMVFRASGLYGSEYKAPLVGIDFRNNPITASTRIDFDWYIDETTGDGYQNHVFSFLPLIHYKDGTTNKAETGVYTSLEPARGSGNLRHFENNRDYTGNYTTEKFNGNWHKVSVITEIVAPESDGGNNSVKMTLIIDGVTVNNAVSRTFGHNPDGLAGLRFKPETNAVSSESMNISAVMAVDNVQIYEISSSTTEKAVKLPASELYTVNNANVMSFTKSVTVQELQNALSAYSVSVKREGNAVTGTIASGDQITIQNSAAVVSECWYASSPAEYKRYVYTFDDNAVTVEGINKITDANSSFRWGTSEMVSASKEVSLTGGLGKHSAADKALTIKTTNFTTSNPNSEVNSPAMTWNTSNVPIDNLLVLDTDVFFSGNQTRAEVRLDFVGKKDNAETALQLDIGFTENKVTFGGKSTFAATCRDGLWHNLTVEVDTDEKKAYAYIDGVLFADGVAINLDTVTKLQQIKFDSRYYLAGGVANGNFAIDNLTLYSGKAENYLNAESDKSDVRVNNALKSILTAKNITNEEMKNALKIPTNFDITLSGQDNAKPQEGDTVTISHKTDSSIQKIYKVSLMEADYCIAEDFESANEIVKEATKNGKSWYYVETRGGFSDWAFEPLGKTAINKDSSNDDYQISLAKGLGGKAASDTTLSVVTKDDTTSNGKYDARSRLSFGNPTGYAYYDGKFFMDFDVYFSGNTPYHQFRADVNYDFKNTGEDNKQIYINIEDTGKVKYGKTQLFADGTFTYGKWHTVRLELDSPNKKMYISVDGTKSAESIDLTNDTKAVTGLQKFLFEQHFDTLSSSDAAPNGVMAVDNFCVYRRGEFEEIRLNSTENAVVDNGAGMIYCSNKQAVNDLTVSSGLTKKVNANTVTVSNGIYSKEYTVLNIAQSDAVTFYEPAYNSIAGDKDNAYLTVNAYAPNFQTTNPVIVLARYNNGELVSAEVTDNTKFTISGDVITFTKQVAAGDKYSVFAFDGFTNLKPLAEAKKEMAYTKPMQIFMLGDSLMCPYNVYSFPQEGWGEVFKQYIDTDRALVYNEAIGGESTTSILAENYGNIDFYSILDRISEGDYVFVSYLHNDRYGGMKDWNNDGVDDSKFGCTLSEYKENLKTIIAKIREKGATPVFVTGPNTGREYNQHVITPPGYTASTTNTWDGSGDWPQAMRDVATEKGVALIDLYQIHNAYIDSVAKEEAGITGDEPYLTTGAGVPESVKREMFLYQLVDRGIITEAARNNHRNNNISGNNNGYVDSDLTHFSLKGVQMIAQWVTDAIKASTDSTLTTLKSYFK